MKSEAFDSFKYELPLGVKHNDIVYAFSISRCKPNKEDTISLTPEPLFLIHPTTELHPLQVIVLHV